MCLAIPGQIVSVTEDEPMLRMGRVDFGGVARAVSLACVPEARVGDFVLVHAGTAIATVDPVEAERTLAYLRTLDVPNVTGAAADAGEVE